MKTLPKLSHEDAVERIQLTSESYEICDALSKKEELVIEKILNVSNELRVNRALFELLNHIDSVELPQSIIDGIIKSNGIHIGNPARYAKRKFVEQLMSSLGQIGADDLAESLREWFK